MTEYKDNPMIKNLNGLPDLLWLQSFAVLMRASSAILYLNVIGPILALMVAWGISEVLGQTELTETIVSWWVSIAVLVYCILIATLMIKASLGLIRHRFKVLDNDHRIERSASDYISWARYFNRLPYLLFWMSIAFILFQFLAALVSLGWAINVGYTPLSTSGGTYAMHSIPAEQQQIDNILNLMFMIAYVAPFVLLVPIYLYLIPISKMMEEDMRNSFTTFYVMIGLLIFFIVMLSVGLAYSFNVLIILGTIFIVLIGILLYVSVLILAIQCFSFASSVKRITKDVLAAHATLEMNNE